MQCDVNNRLFPAVRSWNDTGLGALPSKKKRKDKMYAGTTIFGQGRLKSVGSTMDAKIRKENYKRCRKKTHVFSTVFDRFYKSHKVIIWKTRILKEVKTMKRIRSLKESVDLVRQMHWNSLKSILCGWKKNFSGHFLRIPIQALSSFDTKVDSISYYYVSVS